jgi:hypothetical protein
MKRSLLLLVLALVLGAQVVAAQSASAPEILLRALGLPVGIRYSAAFIKPAEMALDEVQAEIKLPPGVELVEVFETQEIKFEGIVRGADGDRLIWRSLTPISTSEFLDTLAFTLSEEVSSDLEVALVFKREGEETSETLQFVGKPAVIPAATTQSTITLGAEGTGGELLPVGETGVLVGAAADLLPDNTTVTVSELPPEANPPPEAGDLWWCSLVAVDNMPEGAALSVVVPLRRPLEPFTPVTLFALQEDGSWLQLETQGIVSPDGQYVSYVHPGGTVATGVEVELQPQFAEIVELETAPELPTGERADISYPLCADVDSAATPCTLYSGVTRQCLPGFNNCIFTSEAFGACFDPGIMGPEGGGGPLCADALAAPPE